MTGRPAEVNVKDIAARFAEVEKRVRALAEENHGLREKVHALEEELGRASEGAREAEALRAKKEQVRDRLKRLLRVLDSMEIKEKEKDRRDPEDGQAPLEADASKAGQAGAKE